MSIARHHAGPRRAEGVAEDLRQSLRPPGSLAGAQDRPHRIRAGPSVRSRRVALPRPARRIDAGRASPELRRGSSRALLDPEAAVAPRRRAGLLAWPLE